MDGYGKTPLHYATTSSSAKILLENGADVNIVDLYGRTPLHFVARMKQIVINFEIQVDYEVEEVIKCIETLIEKGANINARDVTGRCQFHQRFTHEFFVQTSFFYVHVTRKSCQNATFVQKMHTKNVDEIDRRTPLHEAETIEVVQKLIDNNASINAKDKTGATPLHITAQMWGIDPLKCLVANGANVNEKDCDNNTPLHCVGDFDPLFYQKYPSDSFNECCQILIMSGADLNAKNNFGQTPLDNYFVKKVRKEKPDLFETNVSS